MGKSKAKSKSKKPASKKPVTKPAEKKHPPKDNPAPDLEPEAEEVHSAPADLEEVHSAPAAEEVHEPEAAALEAVAVVTVKCRYCGREIPKPDSTFYWCQNVAGDCPGTGDAPVKKFE